MFMDSVMENKQKACNNYHSRKAYRHDDPNSSTSRLIRSHAQIMPGYHPLMPVEILGMDGKKSKTSLANIRHQFCGDPLTSEMEEGGR